MSSITNDKCITAKLNCQLTKVNIYLLISEFVAYIPIRAIILFNTYRKDITNDRAFRTIKSDRKQTSVSSW